MYASNRARLLVFIKVGACLDSVRTTVQASFPSGPFEGLDAPEHCMPASSERPAACFHSLSVLRTRNSDLLHYF